MTLVQSCLHSSLDAGLSSVSERGRQRFLCVWIPGDGTWQEPTPCDKCPKKCHAKATPVTLHKRKDDNSCSRNFLSSSQKSAKNNMPENSTYNIVYKRRKIEQNSAPDAPVSQNSTPTCIYNCIDRNSAPDVSLSQRFMPFCVYKRKKVQRNPAAVFPVQVSAIDNCIERSSALDAPLSESFTPFCVYKRRKVPRDPAAIFPVQVSAIDNCISANSSEAVSAANKEHILAFSHIYDHVLPAESNRLDLASKSRFLDVTSLGYQPTLEEDPESKMQKSLDLCAVIDNFSSSNSNRVIGSSSVKLQGDDAGECSSSGALVMEKNACILFPKHHEGLQGSVPTKSSRFEKQTSVDKNSCCLTSCKVCGQSETTLNILICDLCGESFHLSCCSPTVKNIPVDDWFCGSCLRKKLKKLKETSYSTSSKDDIGPIALMLRDGGPYATNVRIGEDFQAEVPDWSGPITDELDDYGKTMETSHLECASYQDCTSSKLWRFSSTGNWLQCREVIDDDGTICGKWRRAPLFEVQTDDWECFRSVLWDPTHADCAVPQELDTDQVLKHLKYIEMLRPQLAAKRWKVGEMKQHNTNTQTSCRWMA